MVDNKNSSPNGSKSVIDCGFGVTLAYDSKIAMILNENGGLQSWKL